MSGDEMDVEVGQVETEIIVTGGTAGMDSNAEDRVVARAVEVLRRELADGMARRRESSIRDRAFDVPV